MAELAHTKHSLYEQLSLGRKLEEKVETLQGAQLLASDTGRQLASKIAEAELLTEQLRAADARLEPLTARVRELELLLIEANAKFTTQEQIGEQMRTYLDKMMAGAADRAEKGAAA